MKQENNGNERTEEKKEQRESIKENGEISLSHNIHLLSVIGEIEGHECLSANAKTTKYEHVLPRLAAIEDHPVRMNGTVIGAPQTYDYFQQMQDRILGFISDHSRASRQRLEKLMLDTGILTKDLGTILVGADAVKEGLIDEVGGISEALKKLHRMIEEG